MNDTPVRLAEAAGFLARRYAGRASDVAELGGGDWSRAFSFRLGGRDLVARFGRYAEDFARDRQAMAFAGPDLPVPEVLETGRALDGAYAISQRCFGVFLETLDEPGWRRLLPALLRGLDTLREMPGPAGEEPGRGQPGRGEAGGWRELLYSGLADRPGGRVSGWTAVLDRQPGLSALFATARREFGELLDACPEIRHVVHGDLLNRNVLVAADASRPASPTWPTARSPAGRPTWTPSPSAPARSSVRADPGRPGGHGAAVRGGAGSARTRGGAWP